jgi:hypothetical protein
MGLIIQSCEMIVLVRRIAAISVVVLALLGCGVVVAAASGSTPITQTDALAFIRAVNLKPSDLPGSAPFQGEAGSPPEGAEIQDTALRCGHKGKARGRTVAAESAPLSIPYFHGGKLAGQEIVGSSVIVMPSAALARAEIAALGSRSGRICLTHRFSPEAEGPPEARYTVTIRFVPVAKLLGHEAVALHMLARLRTFRPQPGRRQLPPPPAEFLYLVYTTFRLGAADIVFYVASERRQLSATTETRLLSLLHSRAEADKL